MPGRICARVARDQAAHSTTFAFSREKLLPQPFFLGGRLPCRGRAPGGTPELLNKPSSSSTTASSSLHAHGAASHPLRERERERETIVRGLYYCYVAFVLSTQEVFSQVFSLREHRAQASAERADTGGQRHISSKTPLPTHQRRVAGARSQSLRSHRHSRHRPRHSPAPEPTAPIDATAPPLGDRRRPLRLPCIYVHMDMTLWVTCPNGHDLVGFPWNPMLLGCA